MVKSFSRGHLIIFVDGKWLYSDTKEPVENNERDCGHCGKENDENGHDGCLGVLPNVMNACCGHGDDSYAYVQFSPTCCIRGAKAIKHIKQNSPIR